MKKMLWMLLSAALAMASFVSCSQDETVSSSSEDIEAVTDVPVEVNGYASGRGLVVENGDAIAVWWATAESIGVYGSGLTNAEFVGTNKYKNAATTTFKGGSLFKSPKYAYYPYSSANKSASQTAVPGTLPAVQSWNTSTMAMTTDYKIGKYSSRTWTGYNFSFSHVMTFVKFAIDATGTQLEGEKLRRISMTVKSADGQPRQLWGDFTMDLTQSAVNALTWSAPAEGANSVAVLWANTPTLAADKVVTGYLSAAPLVEHGDVIDFEILTENYTATFTRTSEVNYSANLLVNYAMPLADISDLVIKDVVVNTPEEPEEPEVDDTGLAISNFKFTVANNPGKILARSFTHNSSFTVSTSTVSEVACVVDNDNHKITLSLPYLNNRKLVPTFEVPEGVMMITQDGLMIESGVTEVDFAKYKQIAIGTSNDHMAVYDIELTNSGLPVVVVNQTTGTTSSETNSNYSAASEAWYAATGTEWLAKDADWEMTPGVDTFMVYNADGTSAVTDKSGAVVESPIDASTRLRGNVTQQMPKKPFAVKLDKKSGVLGMPAHKRWVLLANWKDRTLMRNAVTSGIAKVFKQVFPNDGMAWNPSGEFVELVYNGVHVGTYYLCEQIKIDENRLSIAEPYDKDDVYSGNPADYGYLLEADDGYDETWQFTTANYIPFLLKDDANADMVDYAQTFVRGVEDELYAGNYDAAFAKMDLTSFVDFLLIQELVMNSEMAHPKSCYHYLHNGTMYAGPLWDFDWNTMPVSATYSENDYSFTESMIADAVATSGWFGSKSYQCYHKRSGYPSEPLNESDANYIWYPMLVKSDAFKALAAERWDAVKAAVQTYVDVEIPKIMEKIAASEALNNKMWPVDSGTTAWGSKRYSIYGIGGGFCGDEGKSFSDAVSTMQSTLTTRINGMSYVSNQNWPTVEYGTK